MVFLPSRGVKIRSEMESVVFPAEPSLLAPRDEGRALLILYVSETTNGYPIIARTRNGINANAGLLTYNIALELYGPEEIWVAQMGNIGELIDQAWTYQAVYYD